MRPAAVEAMLPFLTQNFANPSGAHRYARQARQVLDEARDVMAEVIGCQPGEIVLTGCGTESDNTAITGVIRRSPGVAVCSTAEHHAVLNCVEHAHGRLVRVTTEGTIDLEALQESLGPEVTSVSVMAVNNETGVITDMTAVSKMVRRYAPAAVLHTDAVQAVCWLDLRQLWPLVDTMALSAHKFGGPKGVGILVIREGKYFEPLVMGGGQERDRRSGTHNVAGIVAAAEALRLTDCERALEVARIGALRQRLLTGLLAIDGAHQTIDSAHSVPGIVHICLRGIESESLLFLLDEAQICASAASACASGAMEPSHVLAAMGLEPELTMGALRLSLGHTTTSDDIDVAIAAITAAVARIRTIQERRNL